MPELPLELLLNLREEQNRRVEELNKVWDEEQKWMEEHCVNFGRKKGWVISPEWTIPFIGDILKPERSQEEIDTTLMSYYTENDKEQLKIIFKQIRACSNGEIRQWYSLLDECIATYEAGYFRPVIPSLISVIEGIPAIYAGNPQFDHKRSIKNYCLAMHQNTTRCDLKLVWLSIANYIDCLLKNRDFCRQRLYSLNRHRVQHGRDSCDSWREIDAINLFNTVHTLTWSILNYATDNKG